MSTKGIKVKMCAKNYYLYSKSGLMDRPCGGLFIYFVKSFLFTFVRLLLDILRLGLSTSHI